MLGKNQADSLQMNLLLDTAPTVFTVSELNQALQRVLERDFKAIRLAGEISGCRIAGSGHYYFSLKDEHSQIKAVLFRGSARFLRFKPQDGIAVVARGNLEVYEARGEYQFIVEALELQGAGALQLAFEQLKKRLSAEGLFAQTRKRPLPAFPTRIGLVTSPGGAVIRDMLHVLERRFPGLHIRLYPAQVQGEGSVEQVCEAISYFSRKAWADVLIVARGGGSLEDLWTFNEEAVARAVAGCSIPVISAIGHETDFTICDFTADVRAATPSAAAELVICTRESIVERLRVQERHALQAIRYRLLRCARDLQERGTERAAMLLHRLLSRRAQQIDDNENMLEKATRQGLERRRHAFRALESRLEAANLRLQLTRAAGRLALLDHAMQRQMEMCFNRKQIERNTLDLVLQQMSPFTVLSRGYAIVQDTRGHVLRSADETSAGAALKVRFETGELQVRVEAR